MSDTPDGRPGLIEAEDLGFSFPGPDSGAPLLEGLSFAVRPGLTLVRGGDGRGKTTLLRLMAGALSPTAGVLRRGAASVFHEDMKDPAHDEVVTSAWLAAQRARHAGWDDDLESHLVEAFGLAPHHHKPLYMLSTGSRRKVGLLAAAASGAALTLIDMPFAALDAGSGRVLGGLLVQAAADQARAWVIADHDRPAVLVGVGLAGVVDLGD